MKCPNCGKGIADNRHTCPYCGVSLNTTSPWYTKWWIWVIAAVVVSGIVIGSILAFSSCNNNQNDVPKKRTTTVGTTAPYTESTTAAGMSMDDIVAKGYEKVGYTKLYNNLNKYKGKKVLTAVVAKDIGTDAVYTSLEDNSKTLTNFKFNMADASELSNAKKGDYVAVYGTVNKNGSVSGTIAVDDCHIAAVGSTAKLFADTLKDEKPATTAPTTTKPATTAATAAPVTRATTPATTAAPTTVAPTQATQPTTVPDDKVLFNENNFSISYLSANDGDESFVVKIHFDNKSGDGYHINTENATVNGKDVELESSRFEAVGNGESGDMELYVPRYVLDEEGITSVSQLRFRFVLNDAEDWDSSITSKEIVITP